MRAGAVRWRRANFDWLGWQRFFHPRWRVEALIGDDLWFYVGDCWTRKGAIRMAHDWKRRHR